MQHIPWFISAVLFTGLATVLGMLLRTWMHRSLSKQDIRRAHEVSSAVYLNTGVLYGIVLGLVTVNGLERHVDLVDAMEREASVTFEIGRVADILDPQHERIVRMSARRYAEYVLTQEWSDDNSTGLAHDRAVDSLWSRLATVLRDDGQISEAETFLLEKISDLVQARMIRIGLMRQKISSMVWIILLGGGALIIFFLVGFDPENPRIHALLFASAAITIVSILLLIYSFDHPTHGALGIDPIPFRIILNEIPAR